MARFIYGGKIEQLVVAPDQGLSGALKVAPGATLPALYNKPASDNTRTVVTDFMLDDNGDGVYDVPTSTIVADSTGYPPYFAGPDNVRPLYDAAGHRWDPNDVEGTAPAATETVAGIAEFANTAEIDAGTDPARMVSPVGVARAVDNHTNAATPHPAYTDAINSLTASVGAKANLVGGVVPMDELAASASAAPDTLAIRRAGTGALATGNATADDEAPPLLQVKNLITTGAGSGADVRTLDATTLPLTATGTAAWVGLPTMLVADGVSGQKWEVYYRLTYRSTATAGIVVRHKTGTATVTNKLTNPSFETNTTGWSATAVTTLTRQTTGGAQDGTAYGQLANLGTATNNLSTWNNEWVPTTEGQVWTAAAYARLGAGTGKSFRVDLQFADAANVIVSTVQGTAITPTTGAWTRATHAETTGTPAPTGATQVRVRLIYVNALVNDVVHFDAVQLEPSAPLPAYGSTGGSGATALTFGGSWRGLTLTTPTTDDYRRRRPVRGTTDTGGDFGALGATTDAELEGSFTVTVGGTGLSGQRIELEFADRAADGANHAQVVAATATFARVV